MVSEIGCNLGLGFRFQPLQGNEVKLTNASLYIYNFANHVKYCTCDTCCIH